MNQSKPNPQNTYAVVVGIEKYDKCPDLDGAASNALNFAKWLSKQNVPVANISLFISDLDKKIDLVKDSNFHVKEANRTNIYEGIFTKIRETQGELLYIFWAGHGCIRNVEARKLYYSDDEQTLDLSSLLESLKTSYFPGFNKQIVFVDACATYDYYKSNKQYLGKQRPTEGYGIGDPKRNCEQFVLLASKEGQVAKYNSNEKRGLFSKELLQELLKKETLLLPEEIKEIAENVKNVFHKEYNDEQTPIYLWVRDKDGDIEVLNKSAQDSIFLEKSWKELEIILSAIDQYILYISCYFMLLEFSKDIDGNYPEINCLKSQATDNKEISNILKDILLKVIKNNEESKPIILITKFVWYLLFCLKNQEETKVKLRGWYEKTNNELNRNGINIKSLQTEIEKKLSEVKEQYKDYHPYLIIVYKPKSSEKCYLNAELIFQINNNEPKLIFPIADEIEIALTNIQDAFDTFVFRSYKIIKLHGFTNEQLIIELFLPNAQLLESSEKSYENIQIKIDTFETTKLIGCHHKFVFRSFERLQNMDYIPLTTIKQKWYQLNSFNLSKQEVYKIFKWITCRENCIFESNADIVGINLLSDSEINVMKLLQQQIIGKGLPFFLWIRGICNEPEQLKIEVEELLRVSNLDELLEKIKTKRSDAFNNQTQSQASLGYHLGFLCDNPHRLPSRYSTIGDDICVDFGF
ncbi:hypothetical protein PN456_19760 [Nodularia spumigena CS-586/05]|uniref:VMAP-C domain-containing protein n=1 Tax=Nodularia spumigena TaxID=70799 RepID=UPI002330108C|nr:hypothetical protein [Nodularia spumigena]MDB9345400.1 hypothetical protein [Nodularia spumigena CS-588/06]MDB9371153.1 hypothetical protein [Nodularia spumigena CS-586/05]